MADLVCDGAANQTVPDGVSNDATGLSASQSKQVLMKSDSGDVHISNFTPALPSSFPPANAASLDRTAALFGEAPPSSKIETITASIQTTSIVSIPYNSRNHDSSNPKGIGHYHWFTIQIPEVGELKVKIGVVGLKTGSVIEVLESSVQLDKGKEIVLAAEKIEIKKNVISFKLPDYRTLRINWIHEKRTSVPPHLFPEVQIESFFSIRSNGPKILNREFSSAPQISLIPTKESLLAFERALLQRNQCVSLKLRFNGNIGSFSFVEPLEITGTIDAKGKFQAIGSFPFAVSVVDRKRDPENIEIAHFQLDGDSLSFPYSKDKSVLLSPVSLQSGDSLVGYVFPASSSLRLRTDLENLRYVTFPAFGGNLFRVSRPLALDKEDLILIFSYPPNESISSFPKDGLTVELLSAQGEYLQLGRFYAAADNRWVFQAETGEEKVLSFQGTADGTNLRVNFDVLASEIRPIKVPFLKIQNTKFDSSLTPSLFGSLQLLTVNAQLRTFELMIEGHTLELQVSISATCDESGWSYKPFRGLVDGRRLKKIESIAPQTNGLFIVLPDGRQLIIPPEYLAAAERAAPGLISREEIPEGPSRFHNVAFIAESGVSLKEIASIAINRDLMTDWSKVGKASRKGDELSTKLLDEYGLKRGTMGRTLKSVITQLTLLTPAEVDELNRQDSDSTALDRRRTEVPEDRSSESEQDLARLFARVLELDSKSPNLGHQIYKKLKILFVNGYSQFQPLKDCLEIVIRASERNRDLRPYVNDLLLHAVREWFVPQASTQDIQQEADHQAHRFVSGYLTRKQLSEERIELLKSLVREVSRAINEKKEEAQKEQRKKKERAL